MKHAKVVDTTNEIHSGFQCLQSMSGMPTLARQGGQMLTKSRVQPFNKRGIEHRASFSLRQELLCPFDGSLRHTSGNLDYSFLLGSFDDRGDQQFRPSLQIASSSSDGSFDFFAKSSSNT